MNVHRYELIRLARVRIAYLDPGLHLVSTLHSLGFFLHPDSSFHACSPGGKCIAHSDSFRVLTHPSICALQPSPSLTQIRVLTHPSIRALWEVSASLTQILSVS